MCLFDCIEWLREQLQQWQDQAQAAELAVSAEQLGLGSSDEGDAGGSDEDWDSELQQLPEASTSQVRLTTAMVMPSRAQSAAQTVTVHGAQLQQCFTLHLLQL